MTGAAPVDAAEQEAYDNLRFHTLSRGDPEFVHQYVVDAWLLQHADAATKPMAVAFALITMCLHFERGATGREAQLAHMKLAKRRREWPAFPLPKSRGAVTVHDVMRHDEGKERDAAIEGWCASLWDAYAASHEPVRKLIREALDGA